MAKIGDLCMVDRIYTQRKKELGGKEPDMSDVLDDAQKKARDHARTPMQVGVITTLISFALNNSI